MNGLDGKATSELDGRMEAEHGERIMAEKRADSV
jgi:hypothetical protein